MKLKNIIYIFLIFAVIVALFSFSSWRTANVVEGEAKGNNLVGALSFLTPFFIGIFIILLVALLISESTKHT